MARSIILITGRYFRFVNMYLLLSIFMYYHNLNWLHLHHLIFQVNTFKITALNTLANLQNEYNILVHNVVMPKFTSI